MVWKFYSKPLVLVFVVLLRDFLEEITKILLVPTVCLGSTNIMFSIFYAWFDTLLKGMGESFLLSKDEPLTPNIDGVMAL